MSVTTTDTDQTIKCLDGFYCANVVASLCSMTEAGLRELNVIIAAYEEFLVRVRDTDPVSHQLVTRLLGHETDRRADIKAALQRP